jgi:hypothetical protein
MYGFGFWDLAALNVENYLTFRQTFQLPSSGRICEGWTILEVLYKAGNRWKVWFDGDRWIRRPGCCPVADKNLS